MIKKVCFKCKIEKDLDQFYKHLKMADGHLGKCKDCTKKDSANRELKIRSTQHGLESERTRQREKYKRLGYKEKQKEYDSNKPWTKTSIFKNLNRDIIRQFPDLNYLEFHHWNYNKLKSVFALEIAFHRKVHRRLTLDIETKLFKIDGILIDSKEKHFEFLKAFAKRINYKGTLKQIEL